MNAREELLFTQPSAKQIAFFTNNSARSGTMADAHWHSAWEILFIRRGWGKQRINTSEFDFHMGDVIVIRSGDIHATDALSPKGCDIDVLHFTKAIFPSLVSDELPASGIIHSGEIESETVFNALGQYANTVSSGSDILKTGLVQVLIGLIQQNAAPHLRLYSPLVESVRQHIFGSRQRDLCQHIQRQIGNPQESRFKIVNQHRKGALQTADPRLAPGGGTLRLVLRDDAAGIKQLHRTSDRHLAEAGEAGDLRAADLAASCDGFKYRHHTAAVVLHGTPSFSHKLHLLYTIFPDLSTHRRDSQNRTVSDINYLQSVNTTYHFVW